MELVVVADLAGEGSYHVGDEAMLEANLENLRRRIPGVRFTLVSRCPERDSRRYQAEAVPPLDFPSEPAQEKEREATLENLLQSVRVRRKWQLRTGKVEAPPALKALERDHGLVVSGGGNLCSSWPQLLYERVALITCAAEWGKPAVVTGQTVGPHLRDIERRRLASALQRADLVVARERFSFDLLRSLGVGDHLLLSLDDALFFGRETPAGGEPAGGAGEEHPWIALSLAPYTGLPAAAQPLESVAAQLDEVVTRTGLRIVFLGHASPAEGDLPDAEIGDLVRRHMRRQDAFTVKTTERAIDVARLTRQADLVVSSRYHSLVFGLRAGVPSLGISADDYTYTKLQGALLQAGLEESVISWESVLRGGLTRGVFDHWRQRAELREKILRRLPAWEEAERQRWDRIVSVLQGRKQREPGRKIQLKPAQV
jgi:polysaccharide pyruvyl transferase WcaK-like protein